MTGDDLTVRPARRNREDGERFAWYFEVASDGLARWMLGKPFARIIGEAFLAPGHDLSYEHTWFAESGGRPIGMVSGYSAEAHAVASEKPLAQAAGIRAARLFAVYLLAAPVLDFMSRLEAGDWYLQAVAVDPEQRGAGVGSELLDHAERTAVAAGAGRFVLDVATDNEGARRLYERRGMIVEATSPSMRFVEKTAVHRMAKELHTAP